MTQPLASRRRWLLRTPRSGRSWIGQRRYEYDPAAGRTRRRSDLRTLRVVHGVPIRYTPNLNGDPDPGEVVWTWVPYRDDATRGKDRPVVVIGRSGDVLVAVPVTSKDKGRKDHVPIGTGGWDRRRRPSFAKVDRLITVYADDVRKEGGVLSRAMFEDVIAGVRAYHPMTDIPPPPEPVSAAA